MIPFLAGTFVSCKKSASFAVKLDEVLPNPPVNITSMFCSVTQLVWFFFLFAVRLADGQSLCTSGTLLSNLCPLLFWTVCAGWIIGTLNYLKKQSGHIIINIHLTFCLDQQLQAKALDVTPRHCMCLCARMLVWISIAGAPGLIDWQYLQTKLLPASQPK